MVILPIVFKHADIKSIVDFGCGTGAWLRCAADTGIPDIQGLDGEWVVTDDLCIAPHQFRRADLTKPVELDRKYDLAICLEVAEHLPASSADTLVDSITQASDLVLFSAAIPLQGGTHHINEQWQDYWAELFSIRGYVPIDCVRPRVWRNEGVEWWYAQNVILYAERECIRGEPRLQAAYEATRLQPLSIVHPRKYLWLIDWLHMVRVLRGDLAAVIPPGARFIFVDDDQLRNHVCPDAFPFLEHAGQFMGPPANDATAIQELDRLRRAGASFIAFAEPAFWWLDYYREFDRYMRSEFPCRLDNGRLIVFDLRAGIRPTPEP